MSKNYLIHHGIKGQKWGVRRFQNDDGTYTALGKSRRNKSISDDDKEKIKNAKGHYMWPDREEVKNGKATARNKVERRYSNVTGRRMNEIGRRHGYRNFEDAVDHIGQRHNLEDEGYFDDNGIEIETSKRFVDAYVNATLKDLGIKNTKAAREYVRNYYYDEKKAFLDEIANDLAKGGFSNELINDFKNDEKLQFYGKRIIDYK